MKKVFLMGFAMLAGLMGHANAQGDGYTVKGKIEGLKAIGGSLKGMNFSDGYIYLSGIIKDGEQQIDSVKLENGEFEFNGKTDEPFNGAVYCLTKENTYPAVVRFYLENSPITITGKMDESQTKVADFTLKGSALQDMYDAINEGANKASNRQAISREFQEARQKNDTASVRVLKQQLEESYRKDAEYRENYYKTYPESGYIRLDMMTYFPPQSLEACDRMENEINGMAPKFSSSYMAVQLKKMIADQREREKISAGTEAMDITQPDVDGNMVKLSDYKGKYVLLDFWASWCAPCRAENPNVLKAYQAFHPKGLEILAVSLDSNKDSWLKAVKDDQLPWKQVSDLKGWKNEAAAQYKVQAVPTNFLIDPNGKIVAKNLRGAELQKKLAEILK